ncbi:hypothetical protein RHMOL_Rhmol12G0217600 [Rhododendron molle]|uniref:Uncharacterized protein n=1 Tax=Rhododendron molle TaxID=49168 RepID=A0ACC0LL31_RHOML|nr:hypothetical protein RHMOL_Rhmol12G0217600 [Rhododendron molle]
MANLCFIADNDCCMHFERSFYHFGHLVLTYLVTHSDSCENVVIEDSYISVGDDGIAIKSGWDQYGIAYGRPSANILIRNLIIERSMVSAGVSIGSEISGGVSNITVENLRVWNSRRAVRIKTSPGRGGYVRDITYKNLTLDNVRVGIVIKKKKGTTMSTRMKDLTQKPFRSLRT